MVSVPLAPSAHAQQQAVAKTHPHPHTLSLCVLHRRTRTWTRTLSSKRSQATRSECMSQAFFFPSDSAQFCSFVHLRHTPAVPSHHGCHARRTRGYDEMRECVFGELVVRFSGVVICPWLCITNAPTLAHTQVSSLFSVRVDTLALWVGW
jgi:hypothetical protein